MAMILEQAHHHETNYREPGADNCHPELSNEP